MISRGNDQRRSKRTRLGVNPLSFSFPDSNYSSGLGQIMDGREGVFQDTCFRVAIPFNYDQPSPSGGAISPGLLRYMFKRHMFQWSDEEEEGSIYVSSSTISSV